MPLTNKEVEFIDRVYGPGVDIEQVDYLHGLILREVRSLEGIISILRVLPSSEFSPHAKAQLMFLADRASKQLMNEMREVMRSDG